MKIKYAVILLLIPWIGGSIWLADSKSYDEVIPRLILVWIGLGAGFLNLMFAIGRYKPKS